MFKKLITRRAATFEVGSAARVTVRDWLYQGAYFSETVCVVGLSGDLATVEVAVTPEGIAYRVEERFLDMVPATDGGSTKTPQVPVAWLKPIK
jgi:hypothetical protein